MIMLPSVLLLLRILSFILSFFIERNLLCPHNRIDQFHQFNGAAKAFRSLAFHPRHCPLPGMVPGVKYVDNK